MALYLKLAPKWLVAVEPRSSQPKDSFMTDSTDMEGVIVPLDTWMVCGFECLMSELIIECSLKVLVPFHNDFIDLSLPLGANGDWRR